MSNLDYFDEYAALAMRVKIARHLKELTIEQLAAAINETPRKLRQIEKGTANVDLNTLAKLSIALGVSMNELFFGVYDAAREPNLVNFLPPSNCGEFINKAE